MPLKDLLRAGAVGALMLAGAALAGAAAGAADDGPKVEVLLKSGATVLGQPIRYPSEGAPQVTAVIVTLEPGQETGRHHHPVPLYGQVLAGEVTIDYGDAGTKTYRAGDAFLEAVGTWHNGRNSGKQTLHILAVFIGVEGVPNTVRP